MPPRRADPVDGKSLWFVQARRGTRDREVLRLGLVPLREGAGLGPTQALPLWDARGGCVVASDGTGPLLVHAAVNGGGQDTVEVALPGRRGDAGDAAELEGALPPGVQIDPPTALVRIRDLILDPDGYAWLLPVQPKEEVPGGVEVVRVELGSGRSVLDTVPAFPRAFGPPGVFYTETYAPDDAIRVVRYVMDGSSAG